jgi:hypothetical protein
MKAGLTPLTPSLPLREAEARRQRGGADMEMDSRLKIAGMTAVGAGIMNDEG